MEEDEQETKKEVEGELHHVRSSSQRHHEEGSYEIQSKGREGEKEKGID